MLTTNSVTRLEPAVEGPLHRFRCTVVTRARPEAIWQLWLDVPRWPTWDTPLEDARLEPPFTEVVPGARGLLTPRGSRPTTFEVVSVDPRGYVFRSPLPLGELRVSRTLEPKPDGCAITHEVRFLGVGGWLLGWFLAPGFRRALPHVMQALGRRAEDLS